MVTFVDTSAIFALVDRLDPTHPAVAGAYGDFEPGSLITHRYVVIEALALVRRRHGPAAVVRVIDDLLPSMAIAPVDDPVHEVALAEFRASAGAGPSLVDRTSFAFMRARGIETAFAVDRDFRIAGFNVIPAPAE